MKNKRYTPKLRLLALMTIIMSISFTAFASLKRTINAIKVYNRSPYELRFEQVQKPLSANFASDAQLAASPIGKIGILSIPAQIQEPLSNLMYVNIKFHSYGLMEPPMKLADAFLV